MTGSDSRPAEPSRAREHLRSLLEPGYLLALGVLVEGRPFVGQAPYALWSERGSLVIHVSALARHSRGLRDGAPWSGLISAAASPGADPFQVPRVTFEGNARPIDGTDDSYSEARSVYVERLPSGRRHFELGDFTLVELEVRKGRLVAGFASTFNLTAADLRGL